MSSFAQVTVLDGEETAGSTKIYVLGPRATGKLEISIKDNEDIGR